MFCMAGLKYILSILLLFTLCKPVDSKKLPKPSDISVEFSKGDKRRLDQANEKINAALELWDKVNSSFNPENVTSYKVDSIYTKEGLPMLWKISTLLHDGNTLKYNIYHKNCIDFFTKHKYDAPSGVESAKAFQKEAVNYIQKAELNRHAAENFVNDYKKTYDRFFEAFSLEIIAVKKEGRALQIYSDWPIHYGYIYDADVENDLFKPQVVVAVKMPPQKVDTVKLFKEVVVAEAPDSTIIYYSVQIAAHTLKMKEPHIRATIYKGSLKILEIHEDGWFKYLIGHYKTQDEAMKLLYEIKVDKAFVVAYKNGKRVTLKEVNQP